MKEKKLLKLYEKMLSNFITKIIKEGKRRAK